jgi:hypothetical protein
MRSYHFVTFDTHDLMIDKRSFDELLDFAGREKNVVSIGYDGEMLFAIRRKFVFMG